jgi:hypothetical protein
MDQESSYNIEIRIISTNTRGPWYSINKVVDADTTNFKDLVNEIVDKYPPQYKEVVKVYYYCFVSKLNIEVSTDQELVAMFARHVETKCIYMSIAHHLPSCEPPPIPDWEDLHPMSFKNPSTPSTDPTTKAATETHPSQSNPSIKTATETHPCQSNPSTETATETHPSQSNPSTKANTETQPEDLYLMNPEPDNEHVGVDEENLYSDMVPQKYPVLPYEENPRSDSECDVDCEETDHDYEDGSDPDFDDDPDEPVTDKVPTHILVVVIDKYNPPMDVGSIYPNIATFKLSLATHAIKNQFEYNTEKSESGRVRAYCSARNDGCKWRIHASTMGDNVTVKVTCTN